MKNRYILIIFFILIAACADKREAQNIAADSEIEVKFSIREIDAKHPEYELTFLSGSKIIAKRVYKNGQTIASEGKIPDSQVIERYENGKIRNLVHYKNGKREGKAIGFYENGKVKIESTYKDDNPTGVTKSFYKTGKLKSESEIIAGKKVSYKEYYNNGKLKEEVYYKNGEGISKTYDENGNPVNY